MNSLWKACESGDFNQVSLILSQTTIRDQINKLSQFGFSALHFASESNHHQIIQLLLDSNANPLIPDNSKEKILPIHVCVMKNSLDSLVAFFSHPLVDKRRLINARNAVSLNSTLGLAILMRRVEMVDFLIENFGDLVDSKMKNAKGEAVDLNRKKLVKWSEGLNLNWRNNDILRNENQSDISKNQNQSQNQPNISKNENQSNISRNDNQPEISKNQNQSDISKNQNQSQNQSNISKNQNQSQSQPNIPKNQNQSQNQPNTPKNQNQSQSQSNTPKNQNQSQNQSNISKNQNQSQIKSPQTNSKHEVTPQSDLLREFLSNHEKKKSLAPPTPPPEDEIIFVIDQNGEKMEFSKYLAQESRLANRFKSNQPILDIAEDEIDDDDDEWETDDEES